MTVRGDHAAAWSPLGCGTFVSGQMLGCLVGAGNLRLSVIGVFRLVTQVLGRQYDAKALPFFMR